MKKFMVLLLLFFAFPLVAASAEGAVKIDGTLCGVLGRNFLNDPNDVMLTTASKIIITPMVGGVIEQSCKTITTMAKSAVTYNAENTNLVCSVNTVAGSFDTSNWRQTISSKGVVTLTCIFDTTP